MSSKQKTKMSPSIVRRKSILDFSFHITTPIEPTASAIQREAKEHQSRASEGVEKVADEDVNAQHMLNKPTPF